jgi:ribosomal protein S18 acetylase RimI-like enzyme
MHNFIEATLSDYKQLLPLVNAFELDNQVNYQSIEKINQTKVISDNKKYLKKYLQDKMCKYIIVKENENVLGYIFLSIDETHLGEGYINELYVLPNYRKKGIATKFINMGLQWLKVNKVTEINITVNRKNKNASNLYKKLGL